MGRGLACRSPGQHSDLTSSAEGATNTGLRGFILTLLAVDGVLTAVAAALFLPSWLGTIPFPVSALVAGVVNLALVWAALEWSDSVRVAGLPLWTFLATVVAMMFGGPGGDIIFGSSELGGFAVLVLAAVGALPAAWLLRWRTT